MHYQLALAREGVPVDPVTGMLVGLRLGLLMGLLGGGGGVLAVPALNALGLPLAAAATTSLVVVFVGAIAGLVPHTRAGRVDWKLGLTFGALGSVGAVLGSRVAEVVPDRIRLALFVVLIVVAAIGMLRGRGDARDESVNAVPAGTRWPLVILLASGVGLVVGFFGVGGGFIAVPALVLALHLPIHRAGPTALVVIAVNTAVAFIAHGTAHLDVRLTAFIAAATAVGAVAGALAQPRVPALALQRAFGVLLLLVAVGELWNVTQL